MSLGRKKVENLVVSRFLGGVFLKRNLFCDKQFLSITGYTLGLTA